MFLKTVILLSAVVGSLAQKRAGVVLTGKDNVKGNIIFTQTPKGVHVEGQITGLSPGEHGFHVHALGDLSQGCISTGGHFNPHNKSHGAPDAKVRHVGDLGNIEADQSGTATINFTDNIISLGGEHCILGRAVVVHEGKDDLGLGGHKDSLTTGNAGGRAACGVIGILSPDNWHGMDKHHSGGTSNFPASVTATAILIFTSYLLL